jgi:hypothetical protein
MLKNRQEYHEITYKHMVYNKISRKYVDHYTTLWIFQTMMYNIEYLKSETTDRLGVLLGEVWWPHPTSNLCMNIVMELYQRGLKGNIKV